jgi:hypothetical protein
MGYHGLRAPHPGGLVANIDVRAQPAYSIAEAARYLRVAPGTLRSWTVGRPYPTSAGPRTFAPLIKLAARRPPTLSFWNLVEAHVLRALRTDHGVPVPALRKALKYAEDTLEIQNSRASSSPPASPSSDTLTSSPPTLRMRSGWNEPAQRAGSR